MELAQDGTLLAEDTWGADGLRGRFYPGPSWNFPDPATSTPGVPPYGANPAHPTLYSYLYDPQGSVSQVQGRLRAALARLIVCRFPGGTRA